MATTKITITLQKEQVEEVRELVAAGEATSVSAFVKHAVGMPFTMPRDGERCWINHSRKRAVR